MIDGIKILNLGVEVELLLSNNLIDFPVKVNENTGEIYSHLKRSVEYQGLIFTLTPHGYVKIQGSLHKYHNNGSHNYNDFKYSDLLNVLIDLFKKFSINPLTAKLNNLEFGVNIIVPFNPDLFIDNLIHYKGIQFNRTKRIGQNFAECELKNWYYLKIYNKGLQYDQRNHILRYEIKSIKAEHFKRFNVKYLFDILTYDNLVLMGKYLTESFRSVIYWNQGINLNLLPFKDRELLRDGRSYIFWDELKKKQRKTYYNKLRSFKERIDQYGAYPFNKIPDLISEKWNQLLSCYPENLDKLTDFENTLRNQENRQINISNKVLICPTSATPKYCLVTGIDISMQKGNSRLLSHVGLWYLFENDKQMFLKLQGRLSDRWKDEPIETQIKEIAHYFRNDYYNLQRAIRRIEREPTLFPMVEFLREDKRKIIYEI